MSFYKKCWSGNPPTFLNNNVEIAGADLSVRARDLTLFVIS